MSPSEKSPIIIREETQREELEGEALDTEREVEINEAVDDTCGLGTYLFLIPPHIVYAFLGAETNLLSILGLVLKCIWNLSSIVTSLIEMEVMIIGTISCIIVSNYTDNYGRKQILIWTFAGTLIFGFLSGVFNNIWTFIVLRGLVGVFIGPAEATATTWMPEIPPKKYRSFAVCMCSLTWSIGTVIACFVAYLTMNNYGWRTTVMVLAGMFILLVPILAISRESVRWDGIHGNILNATKTIKLLYRLNNTEFKGKLKPIDKNSQRKKNDVSLKWFAGSKQRMIDFFVVIFFAFSTGVNYYGAAFGGPRFIQSHPSGNVGSSNATCLLNDKDLFRIMISAIPEGAFSILGAVAANVFGRKPCCYAIAILQILVIPIFYAPITNYHVYTVLVMALRCIGSFANTLSILIPSEYFPTKVRSAAEHMSIIGAKTGGCLAIVASQYLFDIKDSVFITFLLIFAILTLVDTICMKETLNIENIDNELQVSYSS